MATALIGGLLNQGIPLGAISVIEVNPQIRERLEKKLELRCFAKPEKEALNCDAVVLAVKPSQMHEACISLKIHLKEQLIISIAAGIRSSDLSRWLGGYKKLVRAMPNMPALIGAGITGLFGLSSAISEAERLGADRVLKAVGSTLWVHDESELDGLTAISGSGPAYVFLFIESLQQAAEELGFTPKQARKLVLETILGATKLAAQSDDSAHTLRERVASKGGTTEAALNVMDEHGFKETVIAAARAARAQSWLLGETFGKD